MVWMRWIAVLALIGFEAGIGVLMLTPKVSADYQDYYISRSTRCWPRPVSGRYQLDQALSFRDDAAGRAAIRHKQCGWVAPFAEGSWSVGDRASLRFSFAPPKQGVFITLEARAFIANSHPQQRVGVMVNGKRLEELLFTAETQGPAIITVPPELAGLDPRGLTLRFDFPDRISPKGLGLSEDTRQLGILLSALAISALP